MNKFLLRLAMILMAVLPLTLLTACGDDDDETSVSDFVGVWAFDDEIEDGYTECGALQFNSDGTGTEGEWDTSKKKFTASKNYSFTWAISGSKIIIYYPKYEETWISNFILSGKKLYMWEDDEEVGQDVYRKVK